MISCPAGLTVLRDLGLVNWPSQSSEVHLVIEGSSFPLVYKLRPEDDNGTKDYPESESAPEYGIGVVDVCQGSAHVVIKEISATLRAAGRGK